MWSPRAEQIVSRLIAKIPPENLNRAEAARLAALPIGGSLCASYYLQPNGEVVIAGNDINHPDVDTVKVEPDEVLRVLVWGAQRYPELQELLPVRPPDAVDCWCRAIPLFAEGRMICTECNGLGWLSIPGAEPGGPAGGG